MTETTETTTPTPARRRTVALWIGAACVAAMGFGLAARGWNWLVQMVATGPVTLSWRVQSRLFYLSLPVGGVVGCWACLKWADTMDFLREFTVWRRRWMALGLIAGMLAASALLSVVLSASARAWCHLWGSPDSVTAAWWGIHEIPEEEGPPEGE